jgi:ferritin-like protein
MITKELIRAEIDNVSGEHLEELYEIIKHFAQSKRQAKKQNLMSRLKSITIDAPEDFAANHDLYVTGRPSAMAAAPYLNSSM